MAVQDDVAAWIASQVDAIGLMFDGDEISGGGYARLTPGWSDADDGAVGLTASLEYDGPPSQVVDAVGFYRGDDLWYSRPIGGAESSRTFNAEGRLDLDSAPIDVELD